MKKPQKKSLEIEPKDPFAQPQEPQQQEEKPELDPHAEIKAKIESVIYCIPDGVTVDALANKLNLGLKADVVKILNELKADYESRPGALKLTQDGNLWKFSIPNEHTNLVLDAALPEFDKAILETLAYIGWRGGSRQCDVVHVRSNKAYKHIQLLIEKGFIESSKSGLSKWLQPTKKFYEYFNIQSNQKLPISKEVEERLEAAQKAAEDAEKAERIAKEQAKAEKAKPEQQTEAKPEETQSELCSDGPSRTRSALETTENDEDNPDGGEPSDDEPDSGGEPDEEGSEPENEVREDEDFKDNPDNE